MTTNSSSESTSARSVDSSASSAAAATSSRFARGPGRRDSARRYACQSWHGRRAARYRTTLVNASTLRLRRLSPEVIVNRDPKVRGPYTAFAEVAGAYERARPTYPDEAVRWLVGDEPRDVVDLGAGTGKLTRSLVAFGHRVTAVEPLDEMRAELEAAIPGADALAGSAEAIPLPDASADVVTSAQAFHWFDHAKALPEIARVLRPGGQLGLVWNSRDDRDPWTALLSGIIGNETVQETDVVPVLDGSGTFEPVETAEFAFEQVLDRDGLLDLVVSRSYLAKLSPAEREPVLAAVRRLYDETAGTDGVRLPYVTECFRTTKKGAT